MSRDSGRRVGRTMPRSGRNVTFPGSTGSPQLVHQLTRIICMDVKARNSVQCNPLSSDELEKINAYWRAANYLSVGQIYLMDNPLLREPLTLEHVKPRLLGHWGTTPGLNLIYAHLNRIIKARDLNARRPGTGRTIALTLTRYHDFRDHGGTRSLSATPVRETSCS